MLVQTQEAHPLFSIFYSPRRTMRRVLDNDPTYLVLPLIALNGIAKSLDNAVSRDLGTRYPLVVILLGCLLGGLIGGFIASYILGFLLTKIGQALGGTGTQGELRAAFAWSAVPTIAGLLVWPILLATLGGNTFAPIDNDLAYNPVAAFVTLGVAAVTLALGLWSIVLNVACVAEAHQFSALRSVGTWLMTIVVFTVPLIVLALAIGLAAGLA
ncbi:MAG: YIP1 family protein [Roseiflexaceae bacterium]|nr:YIP1 family protein [Roseiflexaceae bacterium]